MTALSAPQLRRINRVILALYANTRERQSVETIAKLIETLLPVSWISVDEFDLSTGKLLHLTGRHLEAVPQWREMLKASRRQNLVIDYPLDGSFSPASRVSDFAKFCSFKHTNYFQKMTHHFSDGWDRTVIAIPLPGKSLGITLARDKVFSDEDCLTFALLQPHLRRALHRCMRYLPLCFNPPLTPREREVLHWVSEGKRDGEIASILQISVRTVEHHVGICLAKLGVETRTAAIAAVWRARESYFA